MESIWFEMLEQLEDGLQYQLVLTQRLLCNLFPAFPGPLTTSTDSGDRGDHITTITGRTRDKGRISLLKF